MSRRFRLYLCLTFVLAFFIITPLISLYAAGYKLAGGFSLQKTGTLVIETEPRGAKIYLNGKPQRQFLKQFYSQNDSLIKSPAKIKNLLPGEYEVRLELDNYQPWQKKLVIFPGQSTFAENVSLFRNNLPLLLKRGSYSAVAYSPDGRYAALAGHDDISLYRSETDDNKIYELTASSTDFSKNDLFAITWSPRSKKAIVGKAVFSVDNWERPEMLSATASSAPDKSRWRSDETAIFYSSQGKLFFYSLDSKEERLIEPGNNVTDFMLTGSHLYLADRNGPVSTLTVMDDRGQNILRQISLPGSSYTFLEAELKLISLYDKANQTLYLIEPFNDVKPLRETIAEATMIKWADDTKLLYANDFEIWLYDGKNGGRTLLTRRSDTIKNIFWHPNDNYIIFTNESSIYTLELDDREKRNVTEILSLESIKWPYLNARGETLYFYAKIGSQEGLYRMTIQ